VTGQGLPEVVDLVRLARRPDVVKDFSHIAGALFVFDETLNGSSPVAGRAFGYDSILIGMSCTGEDDFAIRRELEISLPLSIQIPLLQLSGVLRATDHESRTIVADRLTALS
jgi:hypothetical protein